MVASVLVWLGLLLAHLRIWLRSIGFRLNVHRTTWFICSVGYVYANLFSLINNTVQRRNKPRIYFPKGEFTSVTTNLTLMGEVCSFGISRPLDHYTFVNNKNKNAPGHVQENSI